MKIIPRFVVLALLLTFAVPPSVSAHHGSSHANAIVWNGIDMTDGGTYSVPLDTPAPTYVTGPERNLDGEFIIGVFGNLYKIEEGAERQFIESFQDGPSYDDPDDPNDGDELFAWAAPGVYELDIHELQIVPFFIEAARAWLASLFFADVAYAQFGDPPLLATIRFTIIDANAPPEQTTPDPVIIIPGILGSEQHNGEWIIDPILHTYDDLIATLDANDYTPDVDLFPFPYNWRRSNVETALLLKEKIDEVKEICGCSKVDLVAHSMGGLVARQYIQSDAYEQDVDQLIFLGTPHLGAPKAYLMWEGGEVNAGLRDRAMEVLLGHEAKEQGYNSLFEYVKTAPIISVRELLPVYDYIFDQNILRDYPQNYPTNPFLDELRRTTGDLLASDIRLYAFVGETNTNTTINGINVVAPGQYLPLWEHGYPEGFNENSGNPGLILGQGDETVPTASASFVSDNLSTIESEHIALPTETEGDVYKILTGQDAGILVQRLINIPNFKLLIMKILSPADLLIIDPEGKKIGKDFNGQEVNEILNAFYTGFSADSEFITILNPLDGEYKIYSQGIGSGPYTVETSYITNATTTDASFTGNTAPGIVSELNLNIQGDSIAPDALNIVVTYESTLADLETINKLGWINKGVYKALKTQLKTAKKAPPKVAKILLQTILKQLIAYRGRLLNEQGYQILKTDIEKMLAQ